MTRPATVPVAPAIRPTTWRTTRSITSRAARQASRPCRAPTFLITLGLWDPVLFTATPFVQASTTVHELGHNLYLWHGGWPADFGDKDENRPTYIEPNCKPNYLSSMSYMFQVHGLWNNLNQIDMNYSGVQHGNRNEAQLTETQISGAAYRPVWFAPFASMLAQNQGASVPAARFCNGAKFDPAAPAPAQMARVMAANTGDWIDWNGNLSQNQNPAFKQDVNFDGPTYDNNHVLQSPELLRGFNDWENIHLNQVGVGRNVSFFTTSSGILTLDAGSGGALTLLVEAGSGANVLTIDSGSGVGLTVDAGSGVLTIDLGSGTLLLDSGSGVLTVDLGSGGLLVDSGSGAGVLTVDLGSGDRLLAEAGSAQAKELTLEGANETGRAAPSAFNACVIGTGGGCPAEALPALPLHRTYTSWTKPTFGTVAFYHVSRKRLPTGNWEMLPDPTTNTFYIDAEELPQDVHFLYRVQAEFDDGAFGPHSNTSQITGNNVKPAAFNDPSGFVVNKNAASKTFPAPGMLVNDTDEDSPQIFAVPGTFTTAKGGKVVIEASGRFIYTPKKGTTGDDTFTYTATNGKWSRNTASPDSQKFQMNATPLNVGTVTIKIQ